ncbi:MAG TPA: glycosyltransferase family 39 protein, partial [Terriglobales bacterium]|nr:glycosyltransferase family 39 protein [Terriglobales bacterium]
MTLKCAYALAAVVVLVAFSRILVVDRTRPQGFDEPAHVSAGMEWLQFHTYRLDPLHPPLARLAIAAPLYLAGERFRKLDSASLPQFWEAGNSIIYQNGRYLHNLLLARSGMLPFFVILLTVSFVWTRKQFGDLAALAALILLSSLPLVLSFSSLAYTDMPAACLQVSFLFAFAAWLDDPKFTSSAALGTLFGLAVLTKFTSLFYLPIAGGAVLLTRCVLHNKEESGLSLETKLVRNLAIVVLLMSIVTWGGYGFSVGHVDEALDLSTSGMPSFQHFPSLVRGIAKRMVASDWTIPAPSLFVGVAEVWTMNSSAPDAYLFGKHKPGGWWYFFLLEALLKTPLPFLILLVVGLRPLYRRALQRDWKSLVPAIATVSVLTLTTAAKTNYGLRHVLIIFPLLAIIAGCGANELWNAGQKWRELGRAFVLCLIAWQCITVLRPGSDWIAYFNGLGGRDPSRILVTGCDFDCGQDLLNLAEELHRRKVTHVGVAVWSSADVSQMGLPEFEVLEPFQPETGWVAVSIRAMREGSVLHKSYPPGAFAWLDQYRPVAQVGRTIGLYYIPPA